MALRFVVVTLMLSLLCGCAVNPVTGKKELAFIGEASEINTGNQHYRPSRQMQGGDYTTEPEVVRYVQQVGQRLATVSDRPLPYEFRVLNDSTPNAWALPGGKIAINRGLLTELNSEAELAAVLSHEIVHAAARHGAKGMERGLLLQGAVLAAGVASQNSDYAQLAVGGAGVAAQLLNQKYSRDAEREADLYGMRYMAKAGYDPQAAVELQQTFVRLSEGRDSNWLNGLFSSHPPSQERVAANRQTAATLPSGDVGRQRYQQHLAPLLAAGEAYQAYDEGRKALKQNDTALALALAQKALKLQPREALFHGLRGDIRLQQQRYDDAITNYDRALQQDGSYFHYYLQRGLAHQALGHDQQAEADLKRSTDYLPTAPAQHALGRMALQRGDTAAAKQLFASAAQSNSDVGQAARRAYTRLDLPDNPHTYLQLKLGLDQANYLVATIDNQSTEPVHHVVLVIAFNDQQGQQRTAHLSVPGSLAAQQSRRLTTGIGPLDDAQQRRSLKGRVTEAQLLD